MKSGLPSSRLRAPAWPGQTAANMSDYPERKHSAVIRAHLDLESARVLDVGCGDGALLGFMARQGAQGIGLEISERALERAQRAGPRPGVSYICALGEALPFASGALDIVFFFNSLHHVPVPQQGPALAEAGRVLRPGGRLYVVEPLAEGPSHALMLPVEDETEVRARAYEAIGAAAGGPALRTLAEEHYLAPSKVESFAAWRQGIIEVDPRRRPAVEAQGSDWEVAFEAAAERLEEGYCLYYPTRLNLLERI